MNNTPKISVIIPVYKAEQYLRKCLDSVRQQDYTNVEIICVDDGSPDNSGSILDEYAAQDPRFKVIHQENKGQGAARMLALSLATGEWISMVDSDDYLEPGIYAKAAAVITDEVDVICYETRVVEEGDFKQESIKPYLKLPVWGLKKMTPQLARKINVLPWSKLWRRSTIVSNNVFMPEGHIHEDYVFYNCFIPFVRNGYFLKETGYNYLVHGGSLTQSYEADSAENIISYGESWNYILKFYADHDLLELYSDLVIKSLESYIRQANCLPEERNRKECRSTFLSLVIKHNLLDLAVYREHLMPYFAFMQKIDNQMAGLLLPLLKKDANALKVRYKLSFGARRHALKHQHKLLLCFIANLEREQEIPGQSPQ